MQNQEYFPATESNKTVSSTLLSHWISLTCREVTPFFTNILHSAPLFALIFCYCDPLCQENTPSHKDSPGASQASGPPAETVGEEGGSAWQQAHVWAWTERLTGSVACSRFVPPLITWCSWTLQKHSCPPSFRSVRAHRLWVWNRPPPRLISVPSSSLKTAEVCFSVSDRRACGCAGRVLLGRFWDLLKPERFHRVEVFQQTFEGHTGIKPPTGM